MSDQTKGTRFVDRLGKIYGIYTLGFLAFFALMAVVEQAGRGRAADRNSLPAVHHRDLRDDRLAVAYDAGRCLLCRRPRSAVVLQRHGNGGGLDVGCILRRTGRRHLLRRLPLSGLRHRLDGRLRTRECPDGALSQKVRLLHRARFHRGPVMAATWRASAPWLSSWSRHSPM